jgi:hypothetical protein
MNELIAEGVPGAWFRVLLSSIGTFIAVLIPTAAFGLVLTSIAIGYTLYMRRLRRELASQLATWDSPFSNARSRRELLDAYVSRAAIAAIPAKVSRTNARNIIGYHIAQALFAGLRVHDSVNWYSAMMLVGSSIAVGLISFRYLQKASWLWRGIRSRRLVPAPESVRLRVATAVATLSTTLGLNVPVDILIATRSRSIFPSVWERNGRASIVLPLGFLKVQRRNPSMTFAMLAHEFGHIHQRDTDLWFFSETSGRWARVSMAASCATQVVSAFALGMPFSSATALAIAVGQLWHMAQVGNARLTSERLADLAAVLFADGESYLAALDAYLDDVNDPEHEPKSVRMARIRSYVSISGGNK